MGNMYGTLMGTMYGTLMGTMYGMDTNLKWGKIAIIYVYSIKPLILSLLYT